MPDRTERGRQSDEAEMDDDECPGHGIPGNPGTAAPVAAKAPDPPAPASQQTNAVHNTGTIAIGAPAVRDSNYRQGKYDA